MASPVETYDFIKTIVDGPVSFGIAGWFMAKTFLRAFETKDKQLFDSMREETRVCNERFTTLFGSYQALSRQLLDMNSSISRNNEAISNIAKG